MSKAGTKKVTLKYEAKGGTIRSWIFSGMRRISVNLLLVMGALLLVFSTLEGVLRLLAKAAPLRLNQHKVCCEHDPQLGWRHVANRTVTFERSEYSITERFNSRGVRGPEYSLEKEPDEYRIVVLGDSFAEGYTVEFEELFSEVLKRHLNEQGGRRVEVINLGVAGYSTDQELLLYQTEGIHYRSDLTILMFHDNDVWYNAQKRYFPWRRGYKPLFRLKEDELQLTNVPVPVLAEEVSFQTQIQTTLAHHSYLYRWIRNRVKNNSTLFSLAISLGLFDRLHVLLVPNLHCQHSRFRHVDAADLIERHLAVIAFDNDRLQQASRGPPGSQTAQFAAQRLDRSSHAPFDVRKIQISHFGSPLRSSCPIDYRLSCIFRYRKAPRRKYQAFEWRIPELGYCSRAPARWPKHP